MFSKYRAVTPYLLFTVCVYLFGAILYGIDTGSFGSLQALPSFTKKFGKYDATTDTYALPSSTKAAMNSIPFAGQALGAFLSSNVADLLGYKLTMIVLAIVQVIAVIIELTCKFTGSWGQFTAGRFLAYATGLAEMVVTHYNSEISPASTRGLLAGSMILFNALGNLWGAGMSRAFATETGDRGWLIPQGVQLIPAAVILTLVWFTPESPRWLVQKNRREEALQSLNKLRPRRDVDNGFTRAEIDNIELSIQEAAGTNREGRWMDLCRGNMLRRTWLAWSLFVFLQFSGVQFCNSYAATLYVSVGLAGKSFTYIVIGNSLQVVSCLFQIIGYDYFGRRIFATLGGFFCFIFLTVIAEVGGSGTNIPTDARSINAIIASVILVQTFSRWSVSNAFVIGAEIGGVKMRRKVLATSGVVNMASAILVTSVVPYLMDVEPGSAGFGARTAWFFAATSLILVFFGLFLIPELKGRSLEEVDELFDAKLRWGWQFASYKTTGTGARIAAIENEDHNHIRKLSATEVELEKSSEQEA